MPATVLLAEDSRSLREDYKDYLEDMGFRVLTASNQEELLAQAAQADALIVDVRLPSGANEGILAVGQLQKDGTLRDEMPLIFISSTAEQEEPCQRTLRAAGIERSRYTWLQKTFELHLLTKRLAEEFARRRP